MFLKVGCYGDVEGLPAFVTLIMGLSRSPLQLQSQQLLLYPGKSIFRYSYAWKWTLPWPFAMVLLII